MSLKDKTAFVAGGGDGVWPAVARRLAEDGAGVVVCTPDEDQAREAEAELEAAGAPAYCIAADPGRPREIEAALGELLRVFGGLDIAVADLTARPPGSLLDIDDATFDAALGADLRAAFGVAQRAARLMVSRGRGGSIVLVADSLVDGAGERSLAGDACGGALERMIAGDGPRARPARRARQPRALSDRGGPRPPAAVPAREAGAGGRGGGRGVVPRWRARLVRERRDARGRLRAGGRPMRPRSLTRSEAPDDDSPATPFAGKVALVTGGTRGIGFAVARRSSARAPAS